MFSKKILGTHDFLSLNIYDIMSFPLYVITKAAIMYTNTYFSNECLFLLQTILLVLGITTSKRLGPASLIACIGVQAILANLLVLKFIKLFGIDATAADCFAIGAIIALNILREYHHEDYTKQAIHFTWIWVLLAACMLEMHTLYKPITNDAINKSYTLLFNQVSRLMLASLMIMAIVQVFDYTIFSIIKKHLQSWAFSLRSVICLLLSQALDTTLYTAILCYEQPAIHFWQLCIWSYAIKVIIIGVMSIGIALSLKQTSPRIAHDISI